MTCSHFFHQHCFYICPRCSVKKRVWCICEVKRNSFSTLHTQLTLPKADFNKRFWWKCRGFFIWCWKHFNNTQIQCWKRTSTIMPLCVLPGGSSPWVQGSGNKMKHQSAVTCPDCTSSSEAPGSSLSACCTHWGCSSPSAASGNISKPISPYAAMQTTFRFTSSSTNSYTWILSAIFLLCFPLISLHS